MSRPVESRPRALARRRTLGQALGSVLLLSTGACTPFVLTRRNPPSLIRLTPKTTFDDGLPALDQRLLIEPPTAASGLNTTRIALRPDPLGLDFFADVQWVEVLPVMVQVLLLESFDASGTFDVLSLESTGLRPDFVLRVSIREFQAEYDEGSAQPPLVNVHLQVRLLRMPRRESLATFSARETVRAAGRPVDEVILAFDEAFGRVQRRIVGWTIEQVIEAEGAS